MGRGTSAAGGGVSRDERGPLHHPLFGGWFPSPRNRGEERVKRIALAAVAGAQGIKGEVRLKLFSDSAASLATQKKLYVGGVERRLLAIRDGKTAVARFEGIEDRSAAEGLRGSLV